MSRPGQNARRLNPTPSIVLLLGGLVVTSQGRPRTVAGILCTYKRPDLVVEMLQRVDRQTLRPDIIVVVDNGGDPSLEHTLPTPTPGGIDVRYVAPGSNIGPAGAFDLGFRRLQDLLGPEDLVIHFDDDDPPVGDDQLAILIEELERQVASDPRIGGIGLSGGRLNTRTGIVAGVTGAERIEDVDHLHGGYLPVYRVVALEDVGGNDASFFYGFEELELGRRLHQRGWRLFVHNELMDRYRSSYPKRNEQPAKLTAPPTDVGWSRFHKERNLIRILRREHLWLALTITVLGRHLLKPLTSLLRAPGTALGRLRLGIRATVAGLRNGGGIDPRYPPP